VVEEDGVEGDALVSPPAAVDSFFVSGEFFVVSAELPAFSWVAGGFILSE